MSSFCAVIDFLDSAVYDNGMPELTVTKTKDYLILKIPLRAVRQGEISVSSRTERMIAQGLKAYAEGRTYGPFNAKEADAFLRKL